MSTIGENVWELWVKKSLFTDCHRNSGDQNALAFGCQMKYPTYWYKARTDFHASGTYYMEINILEKS
jgi:hypothetical protein